MIFINPPYKEAPSARTTTNTGQNAIGVSNTTKIHEKYRADLKKAFRELFAQFFIRIYKEIPNCILGSFSTLKYVSATNFIDFRNIFKARFLKGFIVPADSFDNVSGAFPIGFLVWNLADKKEIKKVKVDMFNENNKKIDKKRFCANKQTINQWIKKFTSNGRENELCAICTIGTDFQHNNYCNIDFWDKIKGVGNAKGISKFSVNKYNLIPICIYFAVRHAIKSSWINDRDQFLYPKEPSLQGTQVTIKATKQSIIDCHKNPSGFSRNDGVDNIADAGLTSKSCNDLYWRNDIEFHSDCLAFTLFHEQNRISTNLPLPKSLPQGEGLSSHSPSLASGNSKLEGDKGGGYVNHFIPFSEVVVGVKEAF